MLIEQQPVTPTDSSATSTVEEYAPHTLAQPESAVATLDVADREVGESAQAAVPAVPQPPETPVTTDIPSPAVTTSAVEAAPVEATAIVANMPPPAPAAIPSVADPVPAPPSAVGPVPAAPPVVEPVDERELTMAELLDNPAHAPRLLQRGEVIDGIVARIDPDEVLVDIGLKSEGVISGREMDDEITGKLYVGSSVLVYVMQPEGPEGHAILSIRRARMEKSWRKAEELYQDDAVIEAEVIDFNKGGLIVDLGRARLRADLPDPRAARPLQGPGRRALRGDRSPGPDEGPRAQAQDHRAEPQSEPADPLRAAGAAGAAQPPQG